MTDFKQTGLQVLKNKCATREPLVYLSVLGNVELQ